MESIKFSIIIPMYNIENYIEKCLNSILQQDYKNYEIIIVDDGSTDLSYENALKAKDERIKIIQKTNGGASSARNEGVIHITGDYIWFVDGDDYLEPQALKELAEKLAEKLYDVIYFKYYKDYGDTKIINIDRADINIKQQNPLLSTSPWSQIINTNFYLQHEFRFLEGIIYEDLALMPYILAKADTMGFIEQPIYNYVYRENSTMHSKKQFRQNRDNKFVAIDIMYGLFEKDGLKEKYKEELEYITIRNLLIAYSTEILPFRKEIYKDRCMKVLEYLNRINPKWYKNKYLKESPLFSRIYVVMFRLRLFALCKLALFFKNRK